MVILDPIRSEEDQQATIARLNETITKYGGTPDHVEVMGKRRLAYQIGKRREGYYVLVVFDTDSTNQVLAEVDRQCRFSEEILRHLCTQAVVGKSKGDPSLAPEDRPPAFGRRPYGGPRAPREGRPEGAEGVAPVAEAAPAAEAEAAPAE
jgi:small subunit ribosomal protein S6